MEEMNKCPVCGNSLMHKKVEKILRGGDNTAIIKVDAEVCDHCGERLYSEEVIKLFESIRQKISKSQVSEYKPIGKTFQVV